MGAINEKIVEILEIAGEIDMHNLSISSSERYLVFMKAKGWPSNDTTTDSIEEQKELVKEKTLRLKTATNQLTQLVDKL